MNYCYSSCTMLLEWQCRQGWRDGQAMCGCNAANTFQTICWRNCVFFQGYSLDDDFIIGYWKQIFQNFLYRNISISYPQPKTTVMLCESDPFTCSIIQTHHVIHTSMLVCIPWWRIWGKRTPSSSSTTTVTLLLLLLLLLSLPRPLPLPLSPPLTPPPHQWWWWWWWW